MTDSQPKSNESDRNRGWRRRMLRGPREREPEGLGEAVAAGALTLGLLTAAAFVGFAWDRYQRRSAHAYATGLVERIAVNGRDALMPPWSGRGRGPSAPTAQATFDAVRRLGDFVPSRGGACAVSSNFALCKGTRYLCQVSGHTPAGGIEAIVGLCNGGRASSWSFEKVDVTVPRDGDDLGNRNEVDLERDGAIRYGVTPPPPELLPARSRQRWKNAPL